MGELRLGKLPNRTPVKITIAVAPELHLALEDYARVYADIYGTPEPLSELIPAIIATFLEGDKGFVRRRGRHKN